MKILITTMKNRVLKTVHLDYNTNFFNDAPKIVDIPKNMEEDLLEKFTPDLTILIKGDKNDFIIQRIAKKYLNMIDQDEDEVLGRYLKEVFPFVEEEKLFDYFQKVYETKKPFEFRELYIIEDILIAVYKCKIFLEGDKLYLIGSYETDKYTLEFLEKKYFNKTKVPYVFIQENRVIDYNESFLKFFNLPNRNLKGEFNYSKLQEYLTVEEKDYDKLMDSINNLLNRVSLYEFLELCVSRNDEENKIYWVKCNCSPSSFNSLPAVRISFEDISELKLNKIKNDILREDLSFVQENLSIAICNNSKVVNKELDIFSDENLIWSPQIYSLLNYEEGFERNEKINLLNYISDEDKNNLEIEIKNWNYEYNPIELKLKINSNSSEEKYFKLSVEGEFDDEDDEKLKSFTGYLIDETKRIKEDLALKKQIINCSEQIYENDFLLKNLEKINNKKETLLNESYFLIDGHLNFLLNYLDYEFENKTNHEKILEEIRKRIKTLKTAYSSIIKYNDSVNIYNHFTKFSEYILDKTPIKINFNTLHKESEIDIPNISYLTLLLNEIVMNIPKSHTEFPVNICLGKANDFIYFVISTEYNLEELLNETSQKFIKNSILKYLDYKLVENEENMSILRIDLPIN